MKYLKYLLTSVLACCVIFSGCNGCDGGEKPDGGDGDIPVSEGDWLVEDGTSEYKIVIPQDGDAILDIAADELKNFFYEATSVELPVIDDTQTDGGKYISIGDTALLASSGIECSQEELGTDGYKIVEKDKNIYLAGATDYASLYSVYGLLEYLFDYDYFASGCYALDTGVEELPLYKFDVTDVPDIESRTASDGVVEGDMYDLLRMRVRPYLEDFITINNKWCHNSFEYVSDADPSGEISEWYSADGSQLCYTAHGDKDKYDALLNAVVDKLKEALIAQPARNCVTLTMEDNFDYCTCGACKAVIEEYGAISASIILFLNDVDDMIDEWFLTEEGAPYARELKLLFFAYLGYEDAPAGYNAEKGVYEAKGGLTLNDGVYCYLCPINMDYYKPITDAFNETYYNTVKAWADITDDLYLWYYSANYNYYLAPYDNFDSMQTNYRFAVESGAVYLFDLRQHDESGAVTGWSALKNYLNYKLAWDCDADVAALTDRFFENYFGPAADEMRAMFDSMRFLTNYNKDNNGLGGTRSLYQLIIDEKFWPKDILKSWIGYCDSALEKISPLKDADPERWQSLTDRIEGEKVSPLYLFVECYSYNTPSEVIQDYKSQFKTIADRLKISKYAEGYDISTLYSKWGI